METEKTQNKNVIFITDNYWQSLDVSALAKSLVAFSLDFNKISLKPNAKNQFLKNEYLTLDYILNNVRPLLAKNGLVVSQLLAGNDIITNLYHKDGQYLGSSVPNTPMQENKGINFLQRVGGGLTYMRRYALCSLLNISISTVDDDGNSYKDKVAEKNTLPPNLYTFAKKAYVRDGNFKSVEKQYKISAAAKKTIKAIELEGKKV